MKRNGSSLLFLFILFPLLVVAQKTHKKCGPREYYTTRTFLQNDSLNQSPYDAIVHINAKGWGTATFISDNVLITAKHLAEKNNLKQIDLYKNVFVNGTVSVVHAVLNKNDFGVMHYTSDCHFISQDISFIVLSPSGVAATRSLFTHAIPLADYKTLHIDPGATVTLSGYPVDLAEEGVQSTDILANKSTTFSELLFDPECPMVGYKLFACSGDSGAPVWVTIEGKQYLIAIHHGGPERRTIFGKEKRNTAALITPEVMSLLR